MTKILTDRVLEECTHEEIIQTPETRNEYGLDVYVCESCNENVSITSLGYKSYFLFCSYDGTSYYTRRLKGNGKRN